MVLRTIDVVKHILTEDYLEIVSSLKIKNKEIILKLIKEDPILYFLLSFFIIVELLPLYTICDYLIWKIENRYERLLHGYKTYIKNKLKNKRTLRQHLLIILNRKIEKSGLFKSLIIYNKTLKKDIKYIYLKNDIKDKYKTLLSAFSFKFYNPMKGTGVSLHEETILKIIFYLIANYNFPTNKFFIYSYRDVLINNIQTYYDILIFFEPLNQDIPTKNNCLLIEYQRDTYDKFKLQKKENYLLNKSILMVPKINPELLNFSKEKKLHIFYIDESISIRSKKDILSFFDPISLMLTVEAKLTNSKLPLILSKN